MTKKEVYTPILPEQFKSQTSKSLLAMKFNIFSNPTTQYPLMFIFIQITTI